MSLTCGALKWLSDHEVLVKHELIEKIDQLEVKIREEEQSNEVNWLESQHEVILKKESLLTLKKMLERVTVHEKSMVAIKERRTKENKAKVRYKDMRRIEPNTTDDVGDKEEDDEFLIENYDDEDDADEKEEEKFPGVQVHTINVNLIISQFNFSFCIDFLL